MIIIITLYDYELLLLFLHQKEKKWVLDDNYDILRKFNSRLLFIIPFIPETLWMLILVEEMNNLYKAQCRAKNSQRKRSWFYSIIVHYEGSKSHFKFS